MKSSNVPIIPNKPSYLSNKENMKPSSPLHSGTTVQPNNSHPKVDRQFNTDGRYKRYQRPTPQLSIHHLYLYSSSSTKNLLDNEIHTSPMSSHVDKNSAKSPITKNSVPSFSSNNTINNSKKSSQYNGFISPTSSTINSSAQYKSNHENKESNTLNNIKQSNNVENKSNTKLNPGYFEIKPISKDNYTSHSFIPSSTQFYSATSTSTPQNINIHNTTAGKNGKYDSILAQLVDMGFDTNKAQMAIENCADKTLQGALDILIQSSTDNDFQKKRSIFESTKPTPVPTKSSTNSYKNTSSSNIKQSQNTERTTYPPKPLRKNNEQNDNENDSSDDDILTNEKEWQRQQEIRRKNYLEALKKQKQNEQQQQQQQQQNNVPQPNSKPYVAKSTSFSSPLPPHPKENNTPTSSENSKTVIGADIIKKVIKARNHGNDLYKLGYYGEAEKSYSQALAILPQIHDLSAIISNNRAAARLKNGQYRQCLIDCNFVIERARDRCRNEPKDKATTLEGGISFQWHDQLVKALHRKAAALESTMRLKEAQSIYEELISIDLNDGKARQGLKRCQSSSTSPPPTTTATTNKNAASSFTSPGYSHTASSTPSSNKNNNTSNYFNSNNNAFNSNGFNNNNNTNNSAASSSAFPDLDYSIFEFNNNNNNNEPPSKAVKEMRERQAKLAKEEAERLEKTDIVDMRIQSWKKGKEKNLRALLTTLDTVLWPSVQWQGATINELLEPKKVKICYMKAIAKVHPDKLSSSATVEQRLLASGVFTVLNQAWDDFRTNNKM